MAGALRPVVLLMSLASVLFVLDGYLDGVYPGGPAWIGSTAYGGFGTIAYVFAAANLLIAVLVAGGSERTLLARIVLAGFFVVERPLTAFALGPKPTEAVVVHLFTVAIELFVLLSALRVWRLGREVESMEMDALLSLEAPSPAPPREADEIIAQPPPRPFALGIIVFLLSAALVADGAVSGYLPGGRHWGLTAETFGWRSYLFALVLLAVAARAVQGRRISLRILLVLALIVFLERAFVPLALRIADPVLLALHGAAAFIALALALTAVGAIRGPGGPSPRRAAPQST